MEKNTAVTLLPGFKYDDFDRAGILSVCVCFQRALHPSVWDGRAL